MQDYNIKYSIPVTEVVAGYKNAIGEFNKIIWASSFEDARSQFKALPGYENAVIIDVNTFNTNPQYNDTNTK